MINYAIRFRDTSQHTLTKPETPHHRLTYIPCNNKKTGIKYVQSIKKMHKSKLRIKSHIKNLKIQCRYKINMNTNNCDYYASLQRRFTAFKL